MRSGHGGRSRRALHAFLETSTAHETCEPKTGPASLLNGCFRKLLAVSLQVNSRGRKREGRRLVREGLKTTSWKPW